MSKTLRLELSLDEPLTGYDARQKLFELDYRALDDVISTGEPLEFKGVSVMGSQIEAYTANNAVKTAIEHVAPEGELTGEEFLTGLCEPQDDGSSPIGTSRLIKMAEELQWSKKVGIADDKPLFAINMTDAIEVAKEKWSLTRDLTEGELDRMRECAGRLCPEWSEDVWGWLSMVVFEDGLKEDA